MQAECVAGDGWLFELLTISNILYQVSGVQGSVCIWPGCLDINSLYIWYLLLYLSLYHPHAHYSLCFPFTCVGILVSE